mmetsp:Transcript_26654/g.76986  ORF Transcript_26654/g.76986 Transcript_26654/m.76986 type:complete len:290 (-) Transcript_26654:155-1024(-)
MSGSSRRCDRGGSRGHGFGARRGGGRLDADIARASELVEPLPQVLLVLLADDLAGGAGGTLRLASQRPVLTPPRISPTHLVGGSGAIEVSGAPGGPPHWGVAVAFVGLSARRCGFVRVFLSSGIGTSRARGLLAARAGENAAYWRPPIPQHDDGQAPVHPQGGEVAERADEEAQDPCHGERHDLPGESHDPQQRAGAWQATCAATSGHPSRRDELQAGASGAILSVADDASSRQHGDERRIADHQQQREDYDAEEQGGDTHKQGVAFERVHVVVEAAVEKVSDVDDHGD